MRSEAPFVLLGAPFILASAIILYVCWTLGPSNQACSCGRCDNSGMRENAPAAASSSGSSTIELLEQLRISLGCKQVEDIHVCLERTGHPDRIQSKGMYTNGETDLGENEAIQDPGADGSAGGGENVALDATTDSDTNTNTNRPKRGIILTSQCSGSSWLVSTLNARPGVIWRDEMLIEYSYPKDERMWQTVTWKKYRADLEQALAPSANESAEILGFKLMYDQIPQRLYGEFAEWLYKEQIYVIHLQRRCAAIQFSSQIRKAQQFLVADGAEIDHATSKEQAAALPKVPKASFRLKLGLETVKTLEENQRNFENYLRLTNAPVFEITYEDLDGRHQSKWFHALLGFLELSNQDSRLQKSELVKVGKKLCEDRIDDLGDNYESLADLRSRLECVRLNKEASNKGGVPDLFFPPQTGQCRLTPSCTQGKYVAMLRTMNLPWYSRDWHPIPWFFGLVGLFGAATAQVVRIYYFREKIYR